MEIVWNSIGIMQQSLGNHVDPMESDRMQMEIPWKSDGYPTESFGNPMEIKWESYGNPMESFGIWKSYKNPAESCENVVESCGNPMEILRKSC